jgi:hypothetical protein
LVHRVRFLLSRVLVVLVIARIVFADSVPAGAKKSQGAHDSRFLHKGFEANRGQKDPAVRFFVCGPGYSIFLTKDGITSVFHGDSARPQTSIRMTFAEANPSVQIEGQVRFSETSNYFKGSDASKWVTRVPHYSDVLYRGIYPGIDLIFHSAGVISSMTGFWRQVLILVRSELHSRASMPFLLTTRATQSPGAAASSCDTIGRSHIRYQEE